MAIEVFEYDIVKDAEEKVGAFTPIKTKQVAFIFRDDDGIKQQTITISVKDDKVFIYKKDSNVGTLQVIPYSGNSILIS